MQIKYFKNFTTTLLITSFIVMPFYGIPKKAEAQSLGAYITGLAPAITQLPLCKGKLTGATKSLFTLHGITAWNILNEKLGSKIGSEIEAEAKKKLDKKTQEAKDQLTRIPVALPATTEEKLDNIEALSKNSNKVLTSTEANDTCLKNIGRLVIKMLLQKMTISMVNWINSGFDGKPAFIQNPSKFFEDIAKNEFLQFGAEINNEELFPFGKAWLRNQAEHFNNKFADNARYSLDELIRNTTPQYSAAGFWLNFDQGGWGAWSAMTQYPQNNSLGFQLMASNELQRRLAGTSQSTAQNVREALQAADGFLGDERCIEAGTGKINLDITRSEYNAALRKTPPEYLCSGWEYVTPGKLIAEAATSSIKGYENNLLKADDLNDAMAAILDAFMARFSADLMEKGYANLGNNGSDGLLAYAQGSFSGDNRTQTEKDFRPVQLASSWLSTNLDFDIRTDLTQALIDEQRTYIEKLEAQNIELNSTTDGKDYKVDAFNYELPDGTVTTNKISNAYGLIPAINQLDYCIPGPHPGWEEDSRRALNAATNTIIAETKETIKDMTGANTIASIAPVAGAAIGTILFPGVGTAIGATVGSIAGGLLGASQSNDADKKLRNYYSNIIGGFTGLVLKHYGDADENIQNVSSKQGAVQALNTIFSRYIDMIHLVYNEKVLPSMYKKAVTEYNKLQGYEQIIENNKDDISAMKNVVTTLEQIKNNVNNLNNIYQHRDTDYENELQNEINAFGRISANMVTGDDIAVADKILEDIIYETNYVYNDLLKGPLGCEKELEVNNHLPDQLNATKRMEYPFPILYTYDMGAGKEIPDPWHSNFRNKTNIKATATTGPGFLSYYIFQNWKGLTYSCDKNQDTGEVKGGGEGDEELPCALQVSDILPGFDRAQPWTSLGQTNNTDGPDGRKKSGPFEHAIGIY